MTNAELIALLQAANPDDDVVIVDGDNAMWWAMGVDSKDGITYIEPGIGFLGNYGDPVAKRAKMPPPLDIK